MAWVLYVEIVQGYSQAARDSKLKELPASVLPTTNKTIARRRRSSVSMCVVEKSGSDIELSAHSPAKDTNIQTPSSSSPSQKQSVCVESNPNIGSVITSSDYLRADSTAAPAVSDIISSNLMAPQPPKRMENMIRFDKTSPSKGASTVTGGSWQEGLRARSLDPPPPAPPLSRNLTDLSSANALSNAPSRGSFKENASNPSESLATAKAHPFGRRISDAADPRTSPPTTALSGVKNSYVNSNERPGSGLKTARIHPRFKPPTRPARDNDRDGAVSRLEQLGPQESNGKAKGLDTQASGSSYTGRDSACKSQRKNDHVAVNEAASVQAMVSCPLFNNVPDGAVCHNDHFSHFTCQKLETSYFGFPFLSL